MISSNIAKKQPANASWSDDMWIMDFGNDDNFSTSWQFDTPPSIAEFGGYDERR